MASNNKQSGQPNANMNNSAMQGSSMQNSDMQKSAQNNMQGSNTHTVVGVFNSTQNAESAITGLRTTGYTQEEISLVSKQQTSADNNNRKSDEIMNKRYYNGGIDNSLDEAYHNRSYNDTTADGAMAGATAGGATGLLLGIGALTIPGLGAIAAAGPIMAALSGAAAGGLAGGLIDWGIPSDTGEQLEQRVREGDALTIVRTTQDKAQKVATIMKGNGALDVQIHPIRQ